MRLEHPNIIEVSQIFHQIDPKTNNVKMCISLKDLAKHYLNISMSNKKHQSVLEARVSLALFKEYCNIMDVDFCDTEANIVPIMVGTNEYAHLYNKMHPDLELVKYSETADKENALNESSSSINQSVNYFEELY